MIGYEILLMGGSSLDAVQRAVEYLEADPTFNAGRGSVLNGKGRVELDAAIMDGSRLLAGAVGCVSGIVHPVALAREILESSPYVMLVGEGALEFAHARGIATCDPEELVVERERQRYRLARASSSRGEAKSPGGMAQPGDTVGAVACDGNGHVAAATSTGGALLKPPGRIGDSPIVGDRKSVV